MASSEVFPLQNDSGSFPSNDYSLLAEVPINNIPNGDMNASNYDFTNMQSALSSTAHDSSIEVQSQLSELHEENSRLKEQLARNSSMMQDLIKTIMSWREHMIVSKNELDENLKAAKGKIASLEEEKLNFFIKAESLKGMNEQEKQKTGAQRAILDNGLESMFTLNCGKAVDSVSQDCSYFRKNFHGNLKCVCQHLEAVLAKITNEEEKTMLRCYISMLKFKISSLKGDVGELSSLQSDEESDYEVVRLKTNQDANEHFFKEIEELKEKIVTKDKELSCLKSEKEELAEKIKEHELKIKEWEMIHKSQFELLNNKLQNESALSEKYKERYNSLQQQIEEYQVKLEQSRNRMTDDRAVKELHEKIQQLEIILQLEQQSKQTEKEKYYEVMKKCENLQVDYDRVSKLLESQLKDEKEKTEKLSLCESDAKKYMEEVDHLTAKLLETQEMLNKSEIELKALKGRLEDMEGDPANFELLKAQIEIYKTDYFEVEATKNRALDELELLKNQLQRYEQSHSPGRSHSSKSSPRLHPRGRRSSEQRDEDDAASPFRCPICTFAFSDENAAQNHVNKCLEESQNS